jgi:quercetin dioxygenase-like cupin family protein
MSPATVIPAGGGEIIGDAPDRRVEILSHGESLDATWSRFGPGRDGADLHVHRLHQDLFYVLDGTFTLRLGPDGRPFELRAGQLARMPPLVVHGFRNASDAELRYLNLHAPGRNFANYLRSIRDGRPITYDQYDPPEDGGRPLEDAVVGEQPRTVELDGARAALLADVEEIAVAELEIETAVAPHVHERETESLYVLDGELELTVDEEQVGAPAGTWIHIPPGAHHALEADGARVLAIHTPAAGLDELLRGFGQRPARAA